MSIFKRLNPRVIIGFCFCFLGAVLFIVSLPVWFWMALLGMVSFVVGGLLLNREL